MMAQRKQSKLEMRVPKPATKGIIRIKVDIRPGPVSPAQRRQYKRWWARLFSEIQAEVEGQRKPTIASSMWLAQSSGAIGGSGDAQG
jgi:hypothetical protein